MVNRANSTSPRENDISTLNENFPVFSTSRSARNKRTERTSVDDLIISLSDSYENQRARQVVEWVRLQGTKRTA